MRNMKKLISAFLVLIMLLTMVPLQGGVGNEFFATKAEAATISFYKVGDILEFGWYPQSKVDDTDLIAELNALGGDNSTWTSYGYYSGTGSWADGQMTAGDWMRYTDVILGSSKYRGVIFDSYRPYYTGDTSSSTYQDDNGYYMGTVYWFLYEPIEWRVLDPKTGMVMSETILDSQAYNNYILSSGTDEYGYTAYWGDANKTYYANNYAESSIRHWLNNDFYNTAFSSAQQNIIEFTALDNSAYSTSYSAYDSEATYDKIYLLSWSDALNENYGFSTSYSEYDTARRAEGSDYAKSQGLWVSTSSTYGGNSYWRLRSAGYSSYFTCIVNYDGYVYRSYDITGNTYFGVRPALNFNLSSDIFQSNVKDVGTASAVGTGEVSVYERKNSFKLTAKQSDYNEKWFELQGVSVQVGANSVEHIEGEEAKFEITRAAITDVSRPPIVLTKDGFKDYIIPNTVANSIKDGETLEAYMCLMSHEAKETGAYISTVFAKSTSGVNYRDLVKSSLTAEKDCKYDIYISAVGLGSDVTYYISQDSSHKIKNSSGIFLSTDLYSELTTKKDVYVWAVDDSGKMTERVKIKLSKSTDDGSLKKMLSMSKYSLGGSGGITIKIPDENPIFGDSTVSLKAFTAPFTIYYDAKNGTYIGTLGFDFYKYEKKDSTTVEVGEKSITVINETEIEEKWLSFKEEFGSFLTKGKDDKENIGNQWKSFVKKCKGASSSTMKASKTEFDVDIIGYLEFAITEQGFVIKEANIKVGADFSYSYNYQGALWVIPAYFKTTLGASASLQGSAKRTTVDKAVPFEFEITLDIEPSVALEAGIGVEKLVKAGVEVKGTAPIKVEFINQHFTFGFHGEINLNTKAFVFSWKKKVAEGDVNVVDTYWDYPWQTSSVSLFSTSLGVPQYTVEEDEERQDELIEYYNSSTEISERDYLDGMSEWYGEVLSKSKISAASDINIDVLQESVLEEGKPTCVTVGDKALMAWVEDCSTRDSYNRMRLVYSIYDGENWSSPTAVLDDGKNDDAPVLATDGKNVYFAWQKINEVIDENSQATDALQKVDICTATYSFETNKITETEIISCGGYDYSQAITVENGSPVVYFASCEDPSVATSYAIL